MTPPILSLIRGAKATATTLEQASRAFERELAKVWRDLSRHLPGLIQDAQRGSATAIIKAARAARVRRDLQVALTEAGYDGLVESAYGAPIDRLVAQVLANRRLAKVADTFSAGVADKLDALRTFYLADLFDEGDVVTRALRLAIARGIFGSQPLAKILQDVAVVLDGHEGHVRTLYDTSIAIYGRQVEALQAGDDPTSVFLYLGPDDQKTRPFCAKYVGRVLTRAQIDGLNNGQFGPVFLTGGGYNCRHTWTEVSKFSELRDLAGTTQRIPELEAA